MKLSVTEASKRLNVTTGRVRQLITAGELPATRVGHAWILDEADVERYRPRRHGRPISAASAWAFLHHLSGSRYGNEGPSRGVEALHVRWTRQLRELSDEDLIPGFLAFVRNRATRVVLAADREDLPALRMDGRLITAGVSHPEAHLLVNEELEGYVSTRDFQRLRREFLLIPPTLTLRANVVLHVADELPDSLPTAAVAADLAEHRGVREIDEAIRILRGFLHG